MRKVLVLSGVLKDYEPAKGYGELMFISLGSTNLLNTPRHLADILNILYPIYIDGEEAPYVVISGYAALSALLIVCVLMLWGKVEMLIWDAKRKLYNPVHFSKDDITNYLNHLKKMETR